MCPSSYQCFYAKILLYSLRRYEDVCDIVKTLKRQDLYIVKLSDAHNPNPNKHNLHQYPDFVRTYIYLIIIETKLAGVAHVLFSISIILS